MNSSIWIIVAASIATMITRLGVLVMPSRWKQSTFLTYLSKHLPVASFGILVVYSLKNVTIGNYPFGFPELICITIIVVLQLWKDNLLLSIFTSSFVYVVLINVVF